MKTLHNFSCRFISLVTGLALVSIGLQVQAQTAAIAHINGVSVSESQFDDIVKSNAARGTQDTPELRQKIKDELIAREVLVQEAGKLGLDKTPGSIAQLNLLRQNYLVDLMHKEYLEKNPVSEVAVRAEYDRQVKLLNEMKDLQQYKLGIIVLNSKADALSVLASLNKGGSFEKLAKEKSIDASKNSGGSLGWFLPNQILPEIAKEIISLGKGALLPSPVQSSSGWNVVKIEDKRTYKIPSFEESRTLVSKGLEQQGWVNYVQKLREAAKVTP
ncbi:MAG: peptidylprolyl isomerase [Gammaproteobacteria bacterium]|nr:peptidylprolyl isomerase [Gammaproteobacteria bacterium]